jgi:hypothetical protein
MNKEQQREEFEEWALDKVTSLIIDEIDSEYFWVETRLAWEAWQAAQKGLTEQRDEALSDLEFRRQLYVLLAERCDRRTVELAETRVQRDKLAEVVNAATILIAAKGRHNTMLAYEGLRKALQSLTPNNDR